MSGIKYYRLGNDEEPPDEFCVVRDENGELEEFAWYEPMDSFDRELWSIFNGSDWVAASEYRKLKSENDKLRELVLRLWDAALHPETFGNGTSLRQAMRELGMEVDG